MVRTPGKEFYYLNMFPGLNLRQMIPDSTFEPIGPDKDSIVSFSVNSENSAQPRIRQERL